MDVSILISSFNRRAVLLRTLGIVWAEISRPGSPAAEIIVVDNASRDGTAAAVAREFPGVKLIRRRTNGGACAKNDGLLRAGGRFIVFLDDDSYPAPGSLRRMLEHFRLDPQLGAAVFDVVLPDGSRECSAYPTVCIGCGTGFRAEALHQVGGLPRRYFMQAEEYDLSLRLLDAGWSIRRFADLRVEHLKTPGARRAERTTRLDVRNNLTLIATRFPRKWVVPFALDWMSRYRWLARDRGGKHLAAFWRGLIEGAIESLGPSRRQPISDAAFEQFAMIDRIARDMAAMARAAAERSQPWRRILLVDVGKNILPYWLAAEACGLKVVAIADPRMATPWRRYRGVPVLSDAAAGRLSFDAVIVSNSSPIHAAQRAQEWRVRTGRPVVELGGVQRRAVQVA
jgi:GT2 family glycosyltransferase